MWIESKRGFFINTDKLQTIDIYEPDASVSENSGVFEVIGEGGALDDRPVLLYWGTQDECYEYKKRLGSIISVRYVQMNHKDALPKIEPKL